MESSPEMSLSEESGLEVSKGSFPASRWLAKGSWDWTEGLPVGVSSMPWVLLVGVVNGGLDGEYSEG